MRTLANHSWRRLSLAIVAALPTYGLCGPTLYGDDTSAAKPVDPPARAADAAVDRKPAEVVVERTIDGVGDQPRTETIEVKLGEYWIGVRLGELPELVKAQLGLDYGLATVEIMPDCPARKAGIETNDILLRAGKKELREPMDLVEAVNQAKETKLTLVVLRRGKEQSLDVVPAKRPPADPTENVAHVMALNEGNVGPEWAQLERALRAVQGAGKQDNELGLWFVHPPVWLGQAAAAQPQIFTVVELPKDVEVQIRKQGGEPAKIVVKRGDKTWETTEDKLEVIPEQLRGAVARMVSPLKAAPTPVVGHFMAETAPHLRPGAAQIERRVMVVNPQPGASDTSSLDAKLDLILKKLERLENAVGPRAAEEETPAKK